ncbi:unnamed protein product, partial [Cyprideis torosa]
KVQPLKELYVRSHLHPQEQEMQKFWLESRAMLEESVEKRDLAAVQSKLKFQSRIVEVAKIRANEDNARYQNMLTSQKARFAQAQKVWTLLRRSLDQRTSTFLVLLGTFAFHGEAARPHYTYVYDFGDPEIGLEAQAEESRDLEVTRGSYSYLRPDGVLQEVTYYVDGDSGFIGRPPSRRISISSPRGTYYAPSARYSSYSVPQYVSRPRTQAYVISSDALLQPLNSARYGTVPYGSFRDNQQSDFKSTAIVSLAEMPSDLMGPLYFLENAPLLRFQHDLGSFLGPLSLCRRSSLGVVDSRTAPGLLLCVMVALAQSDYAQKSWTPILGSRFQELRPIIQESVEHRPETVEVETESRELFPTPEQNPADVIIRRVKSDGLIFGGNVGAHSSSRLVSSGQSLESSSVESAHGSSSSSSSRASSGGRVFGILERAPEVVQLVPSSGTFSASRQQGFRPALQFVQTAARDQDSSSEEESFPPMGYSFAYNVRDDNELNYQAHEERKDDNGQTTGSYSVLLPDGSLQIVRYTADAVNGYRAEIEKREGAGPVYVAKRRSFAQQIRPATSRVVSSALGSSSSSGSSERLLTVVSRPRTTVLRKVISPPRRQRTRTILRAHHQRGAWQQCRVSGRHRLASRVPRMRNVVDQNYFGKVDPKGSGGMMIVKQGGRDNSCSLRTSPLRPRISASERHWKVSHHENGLRMRLRMCVNTHFDPHVQAVKLRDNQGSLVGGNSEDSLPWNIAKEAVRKGDESTMEDDIEEDPSTVSLAEEDPGEAGREKLILSEDCSLVVLMSEFHGKLDLTTGRLLFFDLSPFREDTERMDFKFLLSQITAVNLRRFNLRRTAIEIFLSNQKSFFINFVRPKTRNRFVSRLLNLLGGLYRRTRNRFVSRLLNLHPPNMASHSARSPQQLLKDSGLTTKWVNREISNFEYLIRLNTIADLDSESVYRDLSRPIGIINPKNEPEVRAKYENFEDPSGTIPKFHYGTHYSNSAGVLHYLVRLEPFTTLHIELQSGRFDVADRQFHSIPATWERLMEGSDVKELIPEFFYNPEFLVNRNRFDLGRLQGTRERVDDVILPPWADSPEDFIAKHRKALESEYVSQHLHEWIDLIFGYKQKGPEAVKALNVFYYCSYEGAVDLDAISDPRERAATEGMINNFGQTPCQLLTFPHPKRSTREEHIAKVSREGRSPDVFSFTHMLKTFYVD